MRTREFSEADRSVFDYMRRIVEAREKANVPLDEDQLCEYIRNLRRKRWSFRKIGEALSISPARASKILKAWQERI